jgi:hypothetical protein
MPTPAREPRWPLLLFALCLGYALWAASIGWHHTVLDFIGFRQAQTALTTFFMVGQPPRLAYETPVVGPPWSIPFEFPVYQWIVASIVHFFDTPLDETGRAVGFLFFLLTLIPAYRLLAWLGFTRAHRVLALCVFVVSPFYLFWSRTFLIESTALFFSMCYLAAALPAVDKVGPARLGIAVLFGIVAALVKITTCFVFSSIILLYFVYRCFLARGENPPADPSENEEANALRWTFLFRAILLLGIPFASGLLWTRFADQHKALHPIGRHLMSSSEIMQRWNYGTLGQRLQWSTWGNILAPAHYALGHGLVFPLAMLGSYFARRRRRIVLACLAVYPLAPLVFTNLYCFHEYYAFANNVLLLAAAAVGLIALMERGGRCRLAGLMGLACFFALAIWRFQVYYYPIQAKNRNELNAVARAVQEVTQPDDVVVILGCDWSSELPYYSRRRCLSVPFWLDPSVEKIPDYLALEPPYQVGAVVVHTAWLPIDRTAMQEAIARAGFSATYHHADPDFEIYSLHAESVRSE